MKLRKRGHIYYVIFQDDEGTRWRISTGERDLKRAQQKAREIIAGNAPNSAVGETSRFTLGEAIDRTSDELWSLQKSWHTQKSLVEKVKESVGHLPVREVSYGKLLEFVQELKSKGNSNGTINRKLSVVSTALRMCTRWESKTGLNYLDAVPSIPYQKEAEIKERYISPEEENAILTECEIRGNLRSDWEWLVFRDLLIFLMETGCRLGEALSLDWKNVSETSITILPEKSKTGKPRVIPLTNRVIQLSRFSNRPHKGRVFDGLDNWSAWRMWNKVRSSLDGLEDVTLHTYRHTCASRLIQAGVSLYVVSKWLGHSSIKTTERYAHLSTTSLEDAKDSMEKLYK